MRLPHLILTFSLSLPSLPLQAQTPNPTPLESPTPVIREISPGLFQVGGAHLNKSARSVSFPAAMNMKGAPLEYVLVTQIGKTHESLLRTEVDPRHINTALLLLNAKGAGNEPFPQQDTDPIPGTQIFIEVSWTQNGTEKRVPLEDLIHNSESNSTLSRGPWIFNGSKVVDGAFLAHAGGSIISLILDPAALINNPRRGAGNDDLWEVRNNGLPELESVVQVTLLLNPPNANPPPNPTPLNPAPQTPATPRL